MEWMLDICDLFDKLPNLQSSQFLEIENLRQYKRPGTLIEWNRGSSKCGESGTGGVLRSGSWLCLGALLGCSGRTPHLHRRFRAVQEPHIALGSKSVELRLGLYLIYNVNPWNGNKVAVLVARHGVIVHSSLEAVERVFHWPAKVRSGIFCWKFCSCGAAKASGHYFTFEAALHQLSIVILEQGLLECWKEVEVGGRNCLEKWKLNGKKGW